MVNNVRLTKDGRYLFGHINQYGLITTRLAYGFIQWWEELGWTIERLDK